MVATSAVAALLVFFLYACQMPDRHAQEVHVGASAFQEHCASCHGDDAKGNGPLAAELEKPVPDLTLLQAKFEGVFPNEYVLGTVDGRHEFLAHGTRMMPIWGNIWRPDSAGDFGEEIEAQRTMNGLLYYLQSIQRSGE